jgi:NAD kinase
LTSVSEFSKPYFNFNPNDARASGFADQLMADMGNFEAEDCDLIINIGGDGTILWSLHELPNAPNFALKPPGSSSALHNGHHNIGNATDLRKAFSEAKAIKLPRLIGQVGLSDGSSLSIQSFQDIHIRSFNSQAVLPKVSINGELKEQDMNCGVIVALPMGSTGINETRGGHKILQEDHQIVLTLDGITNPNIRQQLRKEGRLSRILDSDSTIDISVSPTGEKRVSTIVFDNITMMPDGQLFDPSRPITIDTTMQHIQTLSITADMHDARTLLINPEYRTDNSHS